MPEITSITSTHLLFLKNIYSVTGNNTRGAIQRNRLEKFFSQTLISIKSHPFPVHIHTLALEL